MPIAPPGLRGTKLNMWPYIAKGVSGPRATTSEEKTACRRQPGLRCGCRVHAVSSAGGGGSGQKIFVIFQHALDPGLMLHARIADQC